jgi:hypothetical protein
LKKKGVALAMPFFSGEIRFAGELRRCCGAQAHHVQKRTLWLCAPGALHFIPQKRVSRVFKIKRRRTKATPASRLIFIP